MTHRTNHLDLVGDGHLDATPETAGHTPGLLDARPSGLYTSGKDFICVAMRHPQEQGEWPANAERLAACWNGCIGINPKAVAELLAACRCLLADLEGGCEGLEDHPDCWDLSIAEGREAIAAATG